MVLFGRVTHCNEDKYATVRRSAELPSTSIPRIPADACAQAAPYDAPGPRRFSSRLTVLMARPSSLPIRKMKMSPVIFSRLGTGMVLSGFAFFLVSYDINYSDSWRSALADTLLVAGYLLNFCAWFFVPHMKPILKLWKGLAAVTLTTAGAFGVFALGVLWLMLYG